MNIVNEKKVRVFKKEENNKVKYSVQISKKLQNGDYENAYFPIQFNKEVDLKDKTDIKIKNAWLSFYKWKYQDKEGTSFFIKCSDFEEVGQADVRENRTIETDPFTDFGREHNSGIEISDEESMELPF